MTTLAELLEPLMTSDANVYAEVIIVTPYGEKYLARRFYVADKDTVHLVCDMPNDDEYDARTQVGSSSIEVDE